MQASIDITDEMKLTMARAFDRAWDKFVRVAAPVNDNDADLRASLAQHIVAMVREGEYDGGRLSAGGLVHLRALRDRDRPPMTAESRRAARRAQRMQRRGENGAAYPQNFSQDFSQDLSQDQSEERLEKARGTEPREGG